MVCSRRDFGAGRGSAWSIYGQDPDNVVNEEGLGLGLGSGVGGEIVNSFDAFGPGEDRITLGAATGVNVWTGTGPERRDRKFLQGVSPHHTRPVGVDSPYSPNSREFGMIGPELGTFKGDIRNFPELIYNDHSGVDLDYQFVHLNVNDIGVKVFREGFDTLCWKKTALRGTTKDLGVHPRLERLLFVASGPGVLFAKYKRWGSNAPPRPDDPYPPVEIDPRFVILRHIYDNGGSAGFPHPKDPQLLCCAHHRIAGRPLREALILANIDKIVWVNRGSKCRPADMPAISSAESEFDDNQRLRYEEVRGPGTYQTPNRYDISCSYRVPGMVVLVGAYGCPGDDLSYQCHGTKCNSYGQCPGLLKQRFGAIQTAVRGLRGFPKVKATVYPVHHHVLRVQGPFEFRQADTIRCARLNMKRVRGMLDSIYSPNDDLGMADKMCGIRVELRIAATTAEEAAHYVLENNLCDLLGLLSKEGQYQDVTPAGPRRPDGTPPDLVRVFPVAIVPQEIIAAYGFRITELQPNTW